MYKSGGRRRVDESGEEPAATEVWEEFVESEEAEPFFEEGDPYGQGLLGTDD